MLAKRGEADISLVARGVHLTSMQHNGLTLKIDTESFTVHPTVSDNPAKLGQQDYVILTIKAHGLAEIAESVRPLVGPNTAFVFAQNGLPWWYFYKHGGVYDGRRLESVDPGGHTWNSFGAERCIGSVVWQAADIDSPGVIQHRYGDRMSLGEPDGRSSARIQALSQVLTAAGIKCPVRTNLRNEIWLKLWVNLIFNPISVLTRQTLE